MGAKKPSNKRQKPVANKEPSSATVRHSTASEKKNLKIISPLEINPTRFADRTLLQKMGILERFDELFVGMGLEVLARMDYPTYPDPTIDFLCTMEYTFVNPRVPKAQEGPITFKIKSTAYTISIPDLCEAYGFENNSLMSFPKFAKIDVLWDALAKGNYVSHKAKITKIRHPVMRYTMKLLAHALFGRSETGTSTTTEMCFAFQGLKNVLVEDTDEYGEGPIVQDCLGNDVNYGCVFATYLVGYKKMLIRGRAKAIHIGGILTPLFTKAGVDLSTFLPCPSRAYIDYVYLVNTSTLKANNDPNRFIYKFTDIDEDDQECMLPLDDGNLTCLSSHELVEFIVSVEQCGMPLGEPMEIQETSPSPPSRPSRDDPYRLNTYELPKFNFKPKTKTEKMLSSVIKFQRKINKWQAYAIGKLFKTVKKLKPEGYISSEDEDLHRPQDSED
ncbi:uncharacterized protein LOC111831858 [Capsella rubella]|uniref:uncharacterized protein LOC111831858 n=1 Tax=Capsella rubella TaxID=81985 RepID=UPI000CD52B36|nr:uncharacterized protein LOC111831858 [Capsella rubella]